MTEDRSEDNARPCVVTIAISLKTFQENVRRNMSASIFSSLALPVIRVQVDGRTITELVATGCSLSIASREICQSWTKRPVCVMTIDGETRACFGIGVVTFQLLRLMYWWREKSHMVSTF